MNEDMNRDAGTDLADRLATLFEPVSGEASAIALASYQCLARGRPASIRDIARCAGLDEAVAAAWLQQAPAVYRADDRIIGFWGLSVQPMTHELQIGAARAWAWCAWDALFLADLLQRPVGVRSVTGLTQRPVHLEVTPDGVNHRGEPLRVSFDLPRGDDWSEDVINSFCHHVHFLTEQEAQQWLGAKPDGQVLPLDEAWAAGLAMNRVHFPDRNRPVNLRMADRSDSGQLREGPGT